MNKFVNTKTGKLYTAYSIREIGDKYVVVFKKGGKEYTYDRYTIDLMTGCDLSSTNDVPTSTGKLIVYSYDKTCYNCGEKTQLLTYIVYTGNILDNFTYPWDKIKALKYQNTELHMINEDIEYYGVKVLGDVFSFDEIMVNKYPKRISVAYSKTLRRSYAMNICEHCKAIQGKNFVYKDINRFIRDMTPLNVFDTISFQITNDFLKKCKNHYITP